MATPIDQIKARLPQTGIAKVDDANLAVLAKQAEEFVDATGINCTSDQKDILELEYTSYLVALALQGTSITIDPNFFLDAYKLALSQIANYQAKNRKSDGVDKGGVFTIGRLTKMPDFSGGLRR